jgi:hypothetical protein
MGLKKYLYSKAIIAEEERKTMKKNIIYTPIKSIKRVRDSNTTLTYII